MYWLYLEEGGPPRAGLPEGFMIGSFDHAFDILESVGSTADIEDDTLVQEPVEDGGFPASIGPGTLIPAAVDREIAFLKQILQRHQFKRPRLVQALVAALTAKTRVKSKNRLKTG